MWTAARANYMKRFLDVVFLCLLFQLAYSERAISQIVANWHFYDGTIALLATTNPQNPAQGRTTGIFVAYERSLSGCSPTLSLMSYDGLALGRVTNPRSQVSRSNRNRMVVRVGSRRFIPVGETVMNEYSNGIETVAMYDVDLIAALQSPAEISIAFGDAQPLFRIRALNSVLQHIDAARAHCTR